MDSKRSASRHGVSVGRRAVLRGCGSLMLAAAASGAAGSIAARAGTRRQSATPRRPVVVIDPGHGGVDPGCTSVSGVYEKQVTWEAAALLARKLSATGRYVAILTRGADEYVPLSGRVARARAARADLFVSIHADANPDPHIRGASVFTRSESASDAAAASLAERENRADEATGLRFHASSPEVASILLDMARRRTKNLSQGLARAVVAKLSGEVHMLDHSHRSARFAVLKAPDVPSVLVEMGCLSNPAEDKLLNTASYRDRLMAALAAAIDGYFAAVDRA